MGISYIYISFIYTYIYIYIIHIYIYIYIIHIHIYISFIYIYIYIYIMYIYIYIYIWPFSIAMWVYRVCDPLIFCESTTAGTAGPRWASLQPASELWLTGYIYFSTPRCSKCYCSWTYHTIRYNLYIYIWITLIWSINNWQSIYDSVWYNHVIICH